MSKIMRFFLRSQDIRRHVYHVISALPLDERRPYVIEIKTLTRTLAQNAKMWAVLTDIAKQVEWYGHWLTNEQWKHVLTAALKGQDTVPGINGGFVVLGKSTSKMSVSEMRDLIELAHAFGAEQDVAFGDEARAAIEWARGEPA